MENYFYAYMDLDNKFVKLINLFSNLGLLIVYPTFHVPMNYQINCTLHVTNTKKMYIAFAT